MLSRTEIRTLVELHGSEIINSEGMQSERNNWQHGATTTFAHCLRVACLSVYLADHLRLMGRVDLSSLVRSALLHDYFLYDWHQWDDGRHRLHGFTHPRASLINALRDFDLNPVERNTILRHMFPLTPVPPQFVEGYLVTLADKISATGETLSISRFRKHPNSRHNNRKDKPDMSKPWAKSSSRLTGHRDASPLRVHQEPNPPRTAK